MKAPRENPLGLDIPFDEALCRFIQTEPKEIAADVSPAKKRRRSSSEVDEKSAEQAKP